MSSHRGWPSGTFLLLAVILAFSQVPAGTAASSGERSGGAWSQIVRRWIVEQEYQITWHSRLGVAAVEGLLNGKSNVMAGIMNGKITYTSFSKAINTEKKINAEAWRIAKILSS